MTIEWGIYDKETEELIEGTWSTKEEAQEELDRTFSAAYGYVAQWSEEGPVKA